MTVEQHGIAAPRHFHIDEGRAVGEADHLHAQSLDAARPAPAFDQCDGTVDVAMRLPLGVEVGRLRRNLHVLTQRRHDLGVPGLLRERQRGLRIHHVFPVRARARAAQTRSPLSGMSRWRTPKDFSASTTALTMAGVEPMVAASPMPLAPIGLNGVGVTVWSTVKSGRSSAWGTA